MKYNRAKDIADHWVGYLGQACEQIEIAGSLRRGEVEVKDIELVAIPRATRQLDLFGDEIIKTYPINKLLQGYPLTKNGSRYKQISLKPIKIDLFLVLPPAQWGVIMAIRTGPARFSKQVVTHNSAGGYLPDNMLVRDGALWLYSGDQWQHQNTPTEESFFDGIGLDWLEPAEREYYSQVNLVSERI